MSDHETEPGASTEPSTATATHDTPKKRHAQRREEFQDDVPHHAAGRTFPARVEKALELATICARIADDNRGKDILLLDLRGATPLLDFFIVATMGTRRQANAVAIEIDVEMKRLSEKKLGMEGTEEGSWILIDYGDFVVHLFTPEARGYYAIEEIWGDAPRLEWRDEGRPLPPPPSDD